MVKSLDLELVNKHGPRLIWLLLLASKLLTVQFPLILWLKLVAGAITPLCPCLHKSLFQAICAQFTIGNDRTWDTASLSVMDSPPLWLKSHCLSTVYRSWRLLPSWKARRYSWCMSRCAFVYLYVFISSFVTSHIIYFVASKSYLHAGIPTVCSQYTSVSTVWILISCCVQFIIALAAVSLLHHCGEVTSAIFCP